MEVADGMMAANYVEKGHEEPVKADEGHPIDRLPAELVAEIFRHYIARNSAGIVHLQLVSHKWRNVVLHHPELWCTIDISEPLYPSSVNSYKNHIDSCIERSGNMPLHVTFFIVSWSDRHRLPAKELLQHLASHANDRWRSFRFVWMRTSSLPVQKDHPELELIITHTRNLQSLVIHTNTGLLKDASFLSLASSRPSLRSLDVLPATYGTTFVPLPTLQDLKVSWEFKRHSEPSLYAEQTVPLLPNFPMLQRLTIQGDRHQITPKRALLPSWPSYTAKSVTHLELHGYCRIWTLRQTVFPALQTLIVRGAPEENLHLFFQHHMNWETTDISSTKQLILGCAKSGPPYTLVPLTFDREHRENKIAIRQSFSAVPQLEQMRACGCIWLQLSAEFNAFERVSNAAFTKGCGEPTMMLGTELREILMRR